jgi:hypothetical protein
MGLISFLFPSDDDRLKRAREDMAKGDFAGARKLLLHCKAPEAEALYDECSRELEKKEKKLVKKRLAAQGFHGWKIEVTAKGARRMAELEALARRELEKEGVDLDIAEIDQEAVKAAFARVEKTLKSDAQIRLVPMTKATP